MQKEQGIGGVGCIAVGGNPPAGKLENSGFSCVESNLVVFQTGGGRSSRDGARRFEDQLPLALPEEQAKGDVYAERRKPQGGSHAAEDPAQAGQRLLRRQWVFPPGWRSMPLQLRHGLKHFSYH